MLGDKRGYLISLSPGFVTSYTTNSRNHDCYTELVGVRKVYHSARRQGPSTPQVLYMIREVG
jgi:hypothetical protein